MKETTLQQALNDASREQAEGATALDAYDLQEILRCLENTAVRVAMDTGHARTLYHDLAERWSAIMHSHGITRFGTFNEKFAVVIQQNKGKHQ